MSLMWPKGMVQLRVADVLGLIEMMQTQTGQMICLFEQFEMYSIATMIAKRSFAQKTVAAMYNADQSTVSRIFNEWAPKLGSAGKDMSELDLVMKHNMLKPEVCEENDTQYFDNEGKLKS